jgi:hypothetical protein
MRQMQTMVPGKDKTYIVTCSAIAQDWVNQEPAFKEMVGSLKVERGMSTILQNTLIGGAIGALVGLVLWLGKLATKKKKAAAA